jgi:hypothetical protein
VKFLLGLQYWDGDRDSSLRLLEIFHQTVAEKNPWADLVILYRFDSSPPPDELVGRLRRNFEQVHVLRGHHHGVGWPDGCNGLWYNLMTQVEEKVALWGWRYKAVLSMEADSCPLSDSWLEVLSRDWDDNQVAVLGAWDSRNGDCPGLGHINGNGLFDVRLSRKVPRPLLPPPGRGWDTYFAADFKAAGWQGTHTIRNIWGTPTLSEEAFLQFREEGAVFLHGVKDDSVRQLYLKHR